MKSLRGTLDKNSLQSTEMNCVLNSKRVYKALQRVYTASAALGLAPTQPASSLDIGIYISLSSFRD